MSDKTADLAGPGIGDCDEAQLGEVSVTLWSEVLKQMCRKKNIHVLE